MDFVFFVSATWVWESELPPMTAGIDSKDLDSSPFHRLVVVGVVADVHMLDRGSIPNDNDIHHIR